MTDSARVALLGALALALPGLALLTSLPAEPRILGVLNNTAHGPVFGALAVVLWLLVRRLHWSPSRTYLLAGVTTVAVGGLVELIQPSLGRGASWLDLRTDTLGAAAGLAVVAYWRCASVPRWRRAVLGLVFLQATGWILWPAAVAAAAGWQRAQQFPVLLDGSSRAGDWFLQPAGVRVSRAELPPEFRRPGDRASLRIDIVRGEWPGLTHLEPAPDWRDYTSLRLDLTNPGARPLPLTVRVHDREHNRQLGDRYNGDFVLEPVARHVVTIPLAEVAAAPAGRLLNLGAVDGLIVFATGDPDLRGRTFFVTRIWLE